MADDLMDLIDLIDSMNHMTGFILIDKPAGLTSHDVVDRVRELTGERRVGHAGTLDPFATGLLIVAVGREATKELGQYVGLDKTYEATLVLGATSDTFDREGNIQYPITNNQTITQIKKTEIDRALNKFRGGYDQRAPIYSAKKIQGRKLYELARQGTATQEMRPIKHVTISKLEAGEYVWPRLKIEVDCSSGTYIRSLADDIGRELDCGAYLDELRRTRIGTFKIDQATPLAQLTPEVIHRQCQTPS